MLESTYQHLLILGTGKNGFAIESVENEIVLLDCRGMYAFDQVDDNVFIKHIVLHAEPLHFSQVLYKPFYFLVCSRNFDHIATRHHTHSRIKITQELQVLVVDTVENGSIQSFG